MSSNAPNSSNPYAPPTANVSDGGSQEAVTRADRVVRLGAAVVDWLVFVVVALPIFVAMGFSMGASLSAENPQPELSGGFVVASALTGLLSIAWLVITIVLVARNGQTIGKKLLGIKVVRTDGSKASLGRIFWLRNFVNGIPGAIPFIGYFYTLVDHLFIFGEKQQCVHDMIADTIVVKA